MKKILIYEGEETKVLRTPITNRVNILGGTMVSNLKKCCNIMQHNERVANKIVTSSQNLHIFLSIRL